MFTFFSTVSNHFLTKITRLSRRGSGRGDKMICKNETTEVYLRQLKKNIQ